MVNRLKDVHWSGAPSYFCPSCRLSKNSRHAFKLHVYAYHPDWRGIKLDTFVVKS